MSATVAAELVSAVEEPTGLWSWITTTNHKRIGLLYTGTALAFFLVAVAFAMLMRAQLIGPNRHVVSVSTYNEIFSMHGTTMIFLFAMPILGGGFANYLIPLMIGAKDMAFPRLNALSYWLFLFGGLFLYSAFAFGGALNTGWYSYSPLTNAQYSTTRGVTFWIAAILMVGASSVLGAVNFMVTMLKLRAPGMSFFRMPVFAIATFVNQILILAAIPSLTAALVMLYLDRLHGTVFFNGTNGGDPIIWQHLFWFFGHPEVYILILPAFGILSEVTPVFSRKPLFGRQIMIISICAIGFLSFTVWAHHMFAVGLPNYFDAIMAGTSMLIAIPTGIKIFNWLATMWGGSLQFKPPLLFVAGFLAFFVIGGLTGVMQAAFPFDWQATHAFWIVGHFHNVLFGGTVFSVFAGIYYWFPKMTGRYLNERLGKLHFWLILPGASFTFLPMYALGMLGMPRREYTYPAIPSWDVLNFISSLGGFLIGMAVLVFFVNLAISLRRPREAADNPWDAWTLEWATTSPPPVDNFKTLPPISSERPLWDMVHAAVPVPAYPPDVNMSETPPEVPEMMVLESEPEAAQTSVLPLLAAFAVLVMAVGLLSSLWITVVGAAFLIDVMLRWTLFPWNGPALPDLGGGERFPARGAAMMLFIGSESLFFGALIYTYLHLRIHLGVWPPPGIPRLGLRLISINTVVLLSSSIPASRALAAFRRGNLRATRLWIALTMIMGMGFLAGEALEWSRVGFGLSSGVMGSTFFTLTGFHGLHVTVGLVLLAFMIVRTLRQQRAPETVAERGTAGLVTAGTYYWHFVDAVWVFIFSLVYLL